MLLDFGLPLQELRQQLFICKQQLTCTTDFLPLAPAQDFDVLKQKLTHQLRHALFDEVSGGYYDKDSRGFKFDAVRNALIAEYLCIVDSVILDGEASFYAKKIINHLKKQYLEQKNKCFLGSYYHSLSHLPFAFQGRELVNVLTSQEENLFSALIQKNIQLDKWFAASYKVSLRQAADLIAMPYKQAQVLIGVIGEKLKMLSDIKVVTGEQNILISELNHTSALQQKALILSSLVEAFIWQEKFSLEFFSLNEEMHHEKNSALNQALYAKNSDLLSALVSNITNDKECFSLALSLTQNIDIAYAICQSMQVSYNEHHLNLVAFWFKYLVCALLDNSTQLPDYLRYQLYIVAHILNDYQKISEHDFRQMIQILGKLFCSDIEINLNDIVLQKSSRGLASVQQQQEYLLQYNANKRLLRTC